MSKRNEGRPGYKETQVGWIPDAWRCVSFGKIVKVSQYGLNNPSSASGNYPIIGMGKLVDGKILGNFGDDKVEIDKKEFEAFRIKKGDLLFNRTNSLALVGKSAIAKEDIDAVFASYLVRFKFDRKKASPDFVGYYFNSYFADQRLKSLATKGVSQCNINPTVLRNHFHLPLPSIPEQVRIVEILDAWDKSIGLVGKQIAAKQRLKKGLMQRLLTGRVRFAWFGAPARDGELPKDWRIEELNQLSEIRVSNVDKKSAPDEEPVFLCNYLDAYNNEYISGDIDFMSATASEKEIEKFGLHVGDIVFTKDSETREDIARSALVVEDIDKLVCGYHLGILSPEKGKANGHFLAKTISHGPTNEYFVSHANGVTRFGLTISTIEKAPVALPSIEEQNQIAMVFLNVDREIDFLRKKVALLTDQKRSLMQTLLTGEVRVIFQK